jgi:nitroreductase
VAELLDAVLTRRSYPRVTADTPSTQELLRLIAAAGRVADHGGLRPWRLIELRGDDRVRLGAALVDASGRTGVDAERLAGKPLRAELLVAVVASRKVSPKVPAWEQDVAASGVGHLLGLLLADAGWGVMWRTGPFTRSRQVSDMHGLTEKEELLGWLYVGGVPVEPKPGSSPAIDPAHFLSTP